MARHPALTKEQRLAIVRQSDKQPAWKQKQLGQWAAEAFQLDFVPSQPTISIVLRQGGKPVKPRAATKQPPVVTARPKVVRCPQVEGGTLRWLETQIDQDEAVTVASVQAKAQELTQTLQVAVDGFVVSDTWVDNFMRRHVLHCPFGLSDAEATDGEETQEDAAAARKAVQSEAGKTSRRVLKNLVAKRDSRTPATSRVSAPPAGKRKRDGEPARQVKARR
ncbi:hypothetical protein PHYPSEUDO_009536 [Phytophthora pseudosyringae]|uniref:HTH CENPB-type domain-containing protein n=1 Tax=Phytophthora pseudosyringae TaxID=221518 RepID=A0A8T1WGR6_9STRA|nr:hypothetical protein PHYPSEUDO_009536 [Phytophthora pseudosyringae]